MLKASSGRLSPQKPYVSGERGRFATRSARIDSRESFAIETPIFIARQADSHDLLEYPIRASHPIRANRAHRFARITLRKEAFHNMLPKVFLTEIFGNALGSWTSAPSGHGCPRQNACFFSRVSRALTEVLTRDIRANAPRMSVEYPARKLPLWAAFSFLTVSRKSASNFRKSASNFVFLGGLEECQPFRV